MAVSELLVCATGGAGVLLSSAELGDPRLESAPGQGL